MTTQDIPQDVLDKIGRETAFGPWGADAVNEPMIRHWCEALEDANPVYTDEDFARKSPYGGIIAPGPMALAFSRAALWPSHVEEEPLPLPFTGYESVIQRNEIEFINPLRLGDRVRAKFKLAEVSPARTTRLGVGHFVTVQRLYHNQNGEHFATQSSVVLRFKPAAKRPDGASPATARKPAEPAAAAAAPVQAAKIRTSWEKSLSWEEVKEGMELPAISLPITVTRLVLIGGATRDFNPIHHDRDYARAAGARDASVNTSSHAGLFHRLLTDWAGARAMVRKVSYQMREMNCPGDTMTVAGRVTRVYRSDKGTPLVDLEVLVSNQRGPTASGAGTVELPG